MISIWTRGNTCSHYFSGFRTHFVFSVAQLLPMHGGKYLANLAIWLRSKNMAKLGIPEKSIKNVAQRC